jgi:hypothetical protein
VADFNPQKIHDVAVCGTVKRPASIGMFSKRGGLTSPVCHRVGFAGGSENRLEWVGCVKEDCPYLQARLASLARERCCDDVSQILTFPIPWAFSANPAYAAETDVKTCQKASG